MSNWLEIKALTWLGAPSPSGLSMGPLGFNFTASESVSYINQIVVSTEGAFIFPSCLYVYALSWVFPLDIEVFPLELQSALKPESVSCSAGFLLSGWHQTGWLFSVKQDSLSLHPSQLTSWEEQPCTGLMRSPKWSGHSPQANVSIETWPVLKLRKLEFLIRPLWADGILTWASA